MEINYNLELLLKAILQPKPKLKRHNFKTKKQEKDYWRDMWHKKYKMIRQERHGWLPRGTYWR